MQVTTIEYAGETYYVKKLSGFSLLNAINVNGKLGEIYRDLITSAVIDEKGKAIFNKGEVERMEIAQFSALGSAVLELHSDELENFQNSADLKIKRDQK